MFRVTREISFCYGHRLLDYEEVPLLHGTTAARSSPSKRRSSIIAAWCSTSRYQARRE